MGVAATGLGAGCSVLVSLTAVPQPLIATAMAAAAIIPIVLFMMSSDVIGGPSG